MMENEYLIRVKLHKKAGKGIIESILDDIKKDDCVIESCIEPKHEKWKCFACGGECELSYKGVDTKCPHESVDHKGEVYDTDWRKI